jgi:hypothetical protein
MERLAPAVRSRAVDLSLPAIETAADILKADSDKPSIGMFMSTRPKSATQGRSWALLRDVIYYHLKDERGVLRHVGMRRAVFLNGLRFVRVLDGQNNCDVPVGTNAGGCFQLAESSLQSDVHCRSICLDSLPRRLQDTGRRRVRLIMA